MLTTTESPPFAENVKRERVSLLQQFPNLPFNLLFAAGAIGSEWVEKEPTNARGDRVIVFEEFLLGVAFVSREDLVSTIAAQERLNAIFLGKARAVVSRDRRGISKRLCIGGREFRSHLKDVTRRHDVAVVLGVEVPDGDFGIFRFSLRRGHWSGFCLIEISRVVRSTQPWLVSKDRLIWQR